MSGQPKQGGKGTLTKPSEREELKRCKSELQKAKDKIASLEGQVKSLEVRVLSFEHDFNYEDVRRRLPESMDIDGIFATENARLVNEVKRLERELENSKDPTSLNQTTGAPLPTTNLNKADLNDAYRPAILAEQYSELYDNEWRNAFEYFKEKKQSEPNIIKLLRDGIIAVYHHCSNLARFHGEMLNGMLMGADNKPIKDEDMPPAKLRKFKDARKAFGPEMAEQVCKKFMANAPKNEDVRTNAYVKKWVPLCWLMCVQDPPMYIDIKPYTGPFDSDIFKTYTKSGEAIDFVVLPPLYLHEGGPLLCKGVAEGK